MTRLHICIFCIFCIFGLFDEPGDNQVAREVARGCSRGFSAGREATRGMLTLLYWDVALS